MEEQIAGTHFKYTTENIRKVIKVVGVGGGGGNAVNHMFKTGEVVGVSFLLCNTDYQDLQQSSIPHKITLGEGLGAGNRPEVARKAAEDSAEAIREALCEGDTQMVFITASMGGGTGTGASPVIGRIAREAGLLVVGIVTIPFGFEGRRKILKALKGVKELQENVDAILVINNQKLMELYPTKDMDIALERADETLANAARGISDMVNIPARVNRDFADVRTTLQNGGVAVINTGYASGANRMTKAVKEALYSPLFNNNSIKNAQRLLFFVYSPENEPAIVDEFAELTEFINSMRPDLDVIWGYSKPMPIPQLGVTVLASGFDYGETDRYLRYMADKYEEEKYIKKGHTDGANFTDEDERLLEEFYGPNVVGRGAMRRTEPLVLSIAELDNDALLDELESTPAIKRDAQRVENIRLRYKGGNSRAQSSTQVVQNTFFPTSTPRSQVIHMEPIDTPEESSEDMAQVALRYPAPKDAEQPAEISVEDTDYIDEDAEVIYF